MKCLVCGKEVKGFKGLAKHIVVHNITAEEYTLKYLQSGVVTMCKCGCGSPTNYAKKEYRFFDYILNHHPSTKGKKVHTEESKRKITENNKKTLMKKYGVTNTMFIPGVPEKMQKTCLKNYGVKYFVESSSMRKSATSARRFSFVEVVEICKLKHYIPLFSDGEYKNCRQKLPFLCNIHNEKFKTEVFLVKNMDVNQCPRCKIRGSSASERAVASFISECPGVISKINSRKVIPPFEVDVYIPDKHLAVEYNGLFWHSEKYKPELYHYNKYESCLEKGITLLQIYEDEWRDKRHIWESIIKTELGAVENKYSHNTLLIDEIPLQEDVEKFNNDNNLEGHTESNKHFVLRNINKEIVFCISLLNMHVLDIVSVCSVVDVSIDEVAVCSLMNKVVQWAKSEGHEEIIASSNCRYSRGELFENSGFSIIDHTGIGCEYTDFITRAPLREYFHEDEDVFKIFNPGSLVWSYLLT